MASKIEIIVGTYEEFLLGYKLDCKNEKQVLSQSFADKSHSGSLRCLAIQGKWVASGATDDRIFIYDMKSRKQSQVGNLKPYKFSIIQTLFLADYFNPRRLH